MTHLPARDPFIVYPMSNQTIEKITIGKSGELLVDVKWGERTFIVEISDAGIVVAPKGRDGTANKLACPSVWVDPFKLENKEELEPDDNGEAPLLVHVYFKNPEDAPVTVRGYRKRATLGGDGLSFVNDRKGPK